MNYSIRTDKLNFSYGKTGKDIKNLSLEIPEDSIYGFLGPNGSGKSTTIKLILGLLKNKEANVYFNNTHFKPNRIDCLSKIGTLIENPSLYEHLTARENLKIAAYYRDNIQKNRINEVLEIVRLDYVKKKKVKAFSLGMKQRLGIAIALLSNPKLLILDEPTNGLDPKGIQEIRSLISHLNKDHNTTVFISSHLLSEIEKLCTHVGIIKDGTLIFQDTVSNLKHSQSKSFSLEVETDDTSKLINVLDSKQFRFDHISEKEVSIVLQNKLEIPELIDTLRSERIAIFQLKIKNNLEDLFLKLTEN